MLYELTKKCKFCGNLLKNEQTLYKHYTQMHKDLLGPDELCDMYLR